jgi:hypothetical protein
MGAQRTIAAMRIPQTHRNQIGMRSFSVPGISIDVVNMATFENLSKWNETRGGVFSEKWITGTIPDARQFRKRITPSPDFSLAEHNSDSASASFEIYVAVRPAS